MTFGAILLLAVGLAMDTTAVVAARALAIPRVRPRHVLLVATIFGGFHVVMPLVGWLVGSTLGPFVRAWDHWIAFALLGGIGAKMLWEARGPKRGSETTRDPFEPKVLLLLAVATSIDALAAGLTLPMVHAPLGLSVATIGTVAASLSVAGLLAGRRFGALLGRRLEVVGGLVLIGLGVNVLVQHLRAG